MIALVLDTETTGLAETRLLPLEKQASVIEFTGILVNLKTGHVKKELDLLIKPPKPVSEEITNITGITNLMLEKAPSFKEVHADIFKLIESAPVVIAHNLSFDKQQIDMEAERLKYEIAWPRLQCSVEATVGLKGYRLSLTALYEHLFGEPLVGAHRAMADTKALVRCCVELFKRGVF